MTRVMPAQRPGRSVQEVGTPSEFIYAVQGRFGALTFDLAANGDNSITGEDHFGPGSGKDGLLEPWPIGLNWLNPPYANIGDWARKAAREWVDRNIRTLMLIPAAVGTNYFREYIWPHAKTIALSPRLTFVGHTQSYPKDLVLAHYAEGMAGQFECWRWR